ncbi:MAG TPA: PadR family transcriptional regulator [Bacillota bacterium]|nr:PadR family transcriptional regulator [Bacillota bacterium]
MIFQLGAPLLDACVLAVLQTGDAYGYTLTQKVKEVIDISESTLYPVLRRLEKEKCLETYDEPYQGRNRRYYRLTADGHQKLSFYSNEWKSFVSAVNLLMEGAGNE